MSLSERLRRACQWHEDPRLVALAGTPLGRGAVWLAAALLLPADGRLLVLPLLAVFAFFPRRRVDLLALGSLWVLYERVPLSVRSRGAIPALAGMLSVLSVLALVFLAARNFRRLPATLRRHPDPALHVLLLGGTGLAYAIPAVAALRPGSWPLILAATLQKSLPWLLWRCGYMLLAGKRGTAEGSRFRDHLFYLLPVWGGTTAPFGKGHDYLRQTRVDSREQIAAAQLSGLKLLALSWVWKGAGRLLAATAFGEPVAGLSTIAWLPHLSMPRLATLIATGGASAPDLSTRWAAIVLELVAATLELAAAGHLIIGILRLFGFRVFRNTYKPLLAGSLVDFWNRYFYYFKELLVEFFFFPVFVSSFKRHPRLRMFTATMAAAAFGNFYYHVLTNFGPMLLVPRDLALSRVGSRLFYSVLLGLGIFISMTREQRRRGRAAPARDTVSRLRRLRGVAGVWLFYSLIHIWNVQPVTLGFAQRSRFFLSLWGL